MLPFDQSWGWTFFFIMDLKKLNWNLDEYITYKQVSIYLFEISNIFDMGSYFE